jgi:hypothetical protein
MSNALTKKKKKVAIVGFAPTWNKTPFDDQEFEIWGLNELYKYFERTPNARADRWFEIHNRNSPSKNTKEHITWLQNCPIPLYMWDHYDDMPSSVVFPKEKIIKYLEDKGYSGSKYFTNSISWMIGLAVYMKFEEIHVYGVDMAQESEYQWQRPSCEYFIGLAEGLGIKFYIPGESDLLKAGQLYGFETDNQLRVKMKARIKELKQRKKALEAEINRAQQGIQQHSAAINQITGAIEDCNYWLKNWVD